MKKTQSILLLLLVVVFSSCYTTKITYKYMERIQRGMSPKEVKAILGEPTYRSFDDKGEILEFRSSEYGPAKTIKIRFVDDKVVEMQSYLDRYYDNNCGSGVKEVKEDKKKAGIFRKRYKYPSTCDNGWEACAEGWVNCCHTGGKP